MSSQNTATRVVDRTLQGGLTRLPPGGEIDYRRNWLDREAANSLLDTLITQVDWTQPDIKLFGRAIAIPRMQAWLGEKGAHYAYSGQQFSPDPWPADLKLLACAIAQSLSTPFNSVLANLYRDGNDCMHWHADDETELGDNPTIASISLGASRDFRLRPRSGEAQRLSVKLSHGDLLIMRGDCQSHWLHCLPRRKRVTELRINLTFRQVNLNPTNGAN